MQDLKSRLLDTKETPYDSPIDAALRPLSLHEFIGQEQARQNLKIFIQAALKRGEALDHVLLFGPPGLGKTTLAQIIAKEMGVSFRATSGPVISRAGDLAALLTNLGAGDVLFIDEIHRLSPQIEEVLYPAMEDFVLDLMIGEGPSARSVRLDPSTIYIGWCHDAVWVDYTAPARKIWHSHTTSLLYTKRVNPYSFTSSSSFKPDTNPRGSFRNCETVPGNTSDCRSPIAPCP